MTQVGLALLVHTTQVTISRVLRGLRLPKPDLAARLVRVTGVPLDAIVREYYTRQSRDRVA